MGLPAAKIKETSHIGTESAEKLLNLSKILNSEHSADKILQTIMDSAIDLLGAERGFLILKDGDKFTIPVGRNLDAEDITKAKHKVSFTIAKQVIASEKPMLTECALEAEGLKLAESVQEMKLSSVISVPLLIKGKIFGAIYLDHRHKRGLFKEEDIKILEILRDQAAIALTNAELLKQLEEKNSELIKLTKELEIHNSVLSGQLESQSEEMSFLKQNLEFKYDYSRIIGKSVAIRKIFSLMDKIVANDEPVIIQGESGTGKELIAKSIHFNGPRRRKPFVSENCAALAPSLIESELFGYVKGAFTGAESDKPGLFKSANGGTLFLDEIGDLTPDLQSKLLRVFQEKQVRPVGGKETIPVDIRIITATNKNLKQMVEAKEFREDLFYRLNVLAIELPPLRARSGDIPLLVESFLEKIAKERGELPKTIDKKVLERLCHYNWPGNIRELENEIRKAAAIATTKIEEKDLSPAILQGGGAIKLSKGFDYQGGSLESIMNQIEKGILSDALKKSNGNKAEAARMLQITRATLYDKLKKHDIG
ncbi:MAG: hypothetical protein A3F16_02010 [Deltaproteobacteria bacterium RIFCSPHIGHO2_12_FULL_43_9]|nr:MAG: hypothetical protein A3F16_02010 [Deltaproteobacteria bacterium RIFCSPHIGHO2_12_FULL_43_9]